MAAPAVLFAKCRFAEIRAFTAAIIATSFVGGHMQTS
jgi:hypothetical protein